MYSYGEKKSTTFLKLDGYLISKRVFDFPDNINEVKRNASEYIRVLDLKRIVNEELSFPAHYQKSMRTKDVDKRGWPPYLAVFISPGIFADSMLMNGSDVQTTRESVKIYAETVKNVMNEAAKGQDTGLLAGHGNDPDEIRLNFVYNENLSVANKVEADGGEVRGQTMVEFLHEIDKLKVMDNQYGKQKVIPIITSDVIKTDSGAKLLSMEEILAKMAAFRGEKTYWEADQRIVVGMSSDGIYNKSPSYKDANLIREIKYDDDPSKIISKYQWDESGSVVDKIKDLQLAATAGVPVKLVNANQRERVLSAIYGDDAEGTLILPNVAK